MSASAPLRIAIVGYGKIAEDQHVPSITASMDLELVACVSRRRAGPQGIPAFASIDELRTSGIAVDAVALCNTPDDRPATAFEAISCGWHVLMEKPPASSLGAVHAIEKAAADAGITLFATWHSRFAPAVAAARDWLRGKRIRSVEIEWVEDVRRWHPGQPWIWQPGGFGVFDPGINALSVATEILPFELIVETARLETPADRQTPIAVTLTFDDRDAPEGVRARFDWNVSDGDRHEIRIGTDAGNLVLEGGGARLSVQGAPVLTHGPDEYPALYERFVQLVRDRRREVDDRPLRIVADAFMLGERASVAPFEDEVER